MKEKRTQTVTKKKKQMKKRKDRRKHEEAEMSREKGTERRNDK
jgi:hypothetical protein